MEVGCIGDDETGPCPPASCEKWIVEEEQPELKWIELIDNEGAAIPFEIVNGNTYVAPDFAKEIKLTHEEGGQRIMFGLPEWDPHDVQK